MGEIIFFFSKKLRIKWENYANWQAWSLAHGRHSKNYLLSPFMVSLTFSPCYEVRPILWCSAFIWIHSFPPYCSRWVILDVINHHKADTQYLVVEGFLKYRLQNFWFSGSGLRPRICVSNKFPGGCYASGPQSTPRITHCSSHFQ